MTILRRSLRFCTKWVDILRRPPQFQHQSHLKRTGLNSKVFHKADFTSAGKISENNLVRYATRDEAVQAGKNPCAACKP